MNKTELARAVAEDTGLTNGQAKEAIEATLERIENALMSGNEVSLSGFGKFAISERAARQGRNPQTGETIEIKASKAPRFQPSAPLKAALNG
ncbi:MAG: HU family DNA-binding protein [Actinomycetota bacterium]|nr:HU family DNA-binding protein [Actinomycetota bacterium]MDQ5807903.1 HU family DNA-binding protein [Actinomycetota bacterium]